MNKKIVCSLLVLSLMISLIGCEIAPETSPAHDPELTLVRVMDPQSNMIYVAGIENEDAMVILGEKDNKGNPTNVTGVVYILEEGDAFGIILGDDGLPDSLIDSKGNKVIFEDYTNSTVSISIYDIDQNLILETTTIELDPTDLLMMKQLYESFYSQKAKTWNYQTTATVFKFGALTLSGISCGLALSSAVATGGALTPAVLLACGKYLFSSASVVTQNDIDNMVSTSVSAISCLASGFTVGCDSAALSLLSWAVSNFPNQPPNITSTPVTSATVGQLYSYDANADDPNGDVLSYSLVIKPDGMDITFSTAFISWIPTVSGNFDVIIEVSDGEFSDTQSFTITVEEPGFSIGQVQLITPPNGEILPPGGITFSWSPVSNATKYQFIIYNSEGQIALNAIDPAPHTVSIVELEIEETITWKVRAGDNSGNWGPWSNTWKLTIKSL